MRVQRRTFLKAGALSIVQGNVVQAAVKTVSASSPTSSSALPPSKPVRLINHAVNAFKEKTYGFDSSVLYRSVWWKYFGRESPVPKSLDHVWQQIHLASLFDFRRAALFYERLEAIKNDEETQDFLNNKKPLFDEIVGHNQYGWYVLPSDFDRFNNIWNCLGLSDDAHSFILSNRIDIEGYKNIRGMTSVNMVGQVCEKIWDTKRRFFSKEHWSELADIKNPNQDIFFTICDHIDEKIASWLPGLIKQFFPQVWHEMVHGQHPEIREKLKDKSGHIHDDQLRRADYCDYAWNQIHQGNDYY